MRPVTIALSVTAVLASAPRAFAERSPSVPELRGIDKAVAATDSRYCATRENTKVSTRKRMWAVASGANNCNGGSTEANFFLVKRGSRWRVRYVRYGGPGGIRAGCGPSAVPGDIRCGPRVPNRAGYLAFASTADRQGMRRAEQARPDDTPTAAFVWEPKHEFGVLCFDGGEPSVFQRERGHVWRRGDQPPRAFVDAYTTQCKILAGESA